MENKLANGLVIFLIVPKIKEAMTEVIRHIAFVIASLDRSDVMQKCIAIKQNCIIKMIVRMSVLEKFQEKIIQ